MSAFKAGASLNVPAVKLKTWEIQMLMCEIQIRFSE